MDIIRLRRYKEAKALVDDTNRKDLDIEHPLIQIAWDIKEELLRSPSPPKS